MNVGIVTTWFERGAAYVSKMFQDTLVDGGNEVFIYARGGEQYAINDKNWDHENVWWSRKIISPFSSTVISKRDFKKWIDEKQIELIIFNEQHWFEPLLWCKEWGIKTVAYIDYYTEETVPLFEIYDGIICNTIRHYSVFKHLNTAHFIPWGTDINVFKPYSSELVNENYVTFFHSCGWDTYRKGTDLLLKAFYETKSNSKLIIHTQNEISDPDLKVIIDQLESKGRLQVIQKTVPPPGLFHLGDVYVYPTRLEGIGLTIAEAIASGLGLVLPNNPPMNEFAQKEYSLLIDVEKLYTRKDAYYWPKCEIVIDHLKFILEDLSSKPEEVRLMKIKARDYACKNLNSTKNFKFLNQLVDGVNFNPLKEKTKDIIVSYEEKGYKRFHKLYLKNYFIFNTLRNILVK